MANELNDIISRVAALDQSTGDELRRQIATLTGRRANGLNFERHLPEQVALVGRPIDVGDKVRFIPVRGQTEVESDATWVVTSLSGANGRKTAELLDRATGDTTTREVEDLVFVADFRDPIYPGLISTGRVERGGSEKPFHAVINSENYHALEAMLFTHAGDVDVIYIDPPYNSGARDWKYNNNYVDDQDAYRHSKWLSFMERRLKVAKKLLNPTDSVLIVTIDEKEYMRLGLLLEQVFPSADIQMVSAVINRAGTPRTGRFSRVDEYIFYVLIGSGHVEPSSSTMLGDGDSSAAMPTVWFTAVRRGSGSGRHDKKAGKASFYPVVIDQATGSFIRVGDPLPHHMPRSDFPLAEGELAIWPLGKEARENRWRFAADQMRRYITNGTARLGRRDSDTGLRPVTYLQPGTLENIENGTFVVTGKTAEGALELALGDKAKKVAPRTVWSRTGHFARDHGSHMLSTFIPGRRFPFPKALYAVEDTLRFVVADNPDALVVDFFAGSGTTAHAVMRLNRLDGGRRRSISVTNNEVSAEEHQALIQRRLRPGDPEWEALGICDHVTKPRIAAAITGRIHGDISQRHVEGHYKKYETAQYELRHEGECTNVNAKPKKDGSLPKCRKTHRARSMTTFEDDWPMSEGFEENVEFLTLTYLNPKLVEIDLAFSSIAPLLWMRAGSQGRRINELTDTFDVADTYAVLFSLDASGALLKAIDHNDTLRIVFIVTNDETQFQAVASQLPEGIEAVRLYESYLRTFEINTERA